jgi:hypothetical protein
MILALLRLERFNGWAAGWRRTLADFRARWRREPAPAAGDTTPAPPTGLRPSQSAPADPARGESGGVRPTLAASAADGETRREVRARFDALFDRMLALEDTLDALGKRFALRAMHERRAEQRSLERLENVAEAIERRGLELEALTSVLGRVDLRLERLERKLRHAEVEPEEAATPTDADELALRLERAERVASQTRRLSRSAPEDAIEFLDTAPFSTSSMRGNLAEVSLPTILGILELERRTGMLKVSSDDGSIVSATLRDGSIVGARVRDLDAEPIDAVREALRFERGHFWFRQTGVEVALGPPRSVGSLLLEATRRNDEALRSA